jgi:hypothetical protein
MYLKIWRTKRSSRISCTYKRLLNNDVYINVCLDTLQEDGKMNLGRINSDVSQGNTNFPDQAAEI